MFRETDETVTEPQFVNLSYIQAQHDYLQVGRSGMGGLGRNGSGACGLRAALAASGAAKGLRVQRGVEAACHARPLRACSRCSLAAGPQLPPQPLPGHAGWLPARCLAPCSLTSAPRLLDASQGQYPVIREDAAQMCALQMQAEHGASLSGDTAGFEAALEKFMVRQILASRPRGEWLADVSARYRALAQFSKDDARVQYLRIIRSLPYGNSIFFTVKVRSSLSVRLPAGARTFASSLLFHSARAGSAHPAPLAPASPQCAFAVLGPGPLRPPIPAADAPQGPTAPSLCAAH